MEESSTYQAILQKGEAIGVVRGIEQGVRQGIEQGVQQGKEIGLALGERHLLLRTCYSDLVRNGLVLRLSRNRAVSKRSRR